MQGGAASGVVEPLDAANELVVLVHSAKRIYGEDDSPGYVRAACVQANTHTDSDKATGRDTHRHTDTPTQTHTTKQTAQTHTNTHRHNRRSSRW